MKRFICMLMALVMCFGLCACNINEESGPITFCGRFIEIEEYTNPSSLTYVVYDKDTKTVFYLQSCSGGFLTPYQVYEDGVIYGAVYENGEIVPKPYALGITFEMLGLASKYLE